MPRDKDFSLSVSLSTHCCLCSMPCCVMCPKSCTRCVCGAKLCASVTPVSRHLGLEAAWVIPVTPRWHSVGEPGARPWALQPGVPTPVFAVVLLQPELSPSGE